MYAGRRGRVGCTTSRRSSKPMPSTRGPRRGDNNGGAATVRLLGELRHAIDHSELTLFYQPKYDLDTLTVVEWRSAPLAASPDSECWRRIDSCRWSVGTA